LLSRVQTFANTQNAFSQSVFQQDQIPKQNIDFVTWHIDNIFEKLIAETKARMNWERSQGLIPNDFALARLLFLRKRIVIDPSMPASAGGYYTDNELSPNIAANQDYLALSPLVFFWDKGMLARVLIHELIHGGANPDSQAKSFEESITDTVAAATSERLGYPQAQTGYQDLIKDLAQYLDGVTTAELLAAITSDPKQSILNLLKLLFLKLNVTASNWAQLSDASLENRLVRGLNSLRNLLPRLLNSAYNPEAGLHDQAGGNIYMQEVYDDLTKEMPLLASEVEIQGRIPDFCSHIFSKADPNPLTINNMHSAYAAALVAFDKAGFTDIANLIDTDNGNAFRDYIVSEINRQFATREASHLEA